MINKYNNESKITGGVLIDHYFVILDFNLSILCTAVFLVSSLNFYHSLTKPKKF